MNEGHIQADPPSSNLTSDATDTISRRLTPLQNPVNVLQLQRTLGGPINILPPEILSMIFYWCTPSLSDQDYSQPCFALILSHVCPLWRSVTLAYARLWTYTKLTVAHRDNSPALEIMRIYLSRSRILPVFIDLEFPTVNVWSSYRHLLQSLEQFVSVARRYRPTDTATADSKLVTHLETSSIEGRPATVELYFWSASPSSLFPFVKRASDIEYCTRSNKAVREPSVRIRAVRVAEGPFTLESYQTWASTLTVLVLKNPTGFADLTIHTAAFVLRAFPRLVSCTLHIDSDGAGAMPALQITLAQLRSFELSWAVGIDTGPLLDVLNIPALEELELAGILPDAPPPLVNWRWGHLAALLRRCRPPLTQLILKQFDCLRIHLIDVPALAPGVERLWLDDCLINGAVFRALHACGWGALRELVLLGCYTFDIMALAQSVRERTVGEAKPTLLVYVNDCGEISPDQALVINEMGLTNLKFGPSHPSLRQSDKSV